MAGGTHGVMEESPALADTTVLDGTLTDGVSAYLRAISRTPLLLAA